ncbi:30S ribosomal protein S3 [Candidatus Woesearchaeota archaeon]|nr:30S ribosomal protein S3 [Candidatus Woesearchaeota archaeon]
MIERQIINQRLKEKQIEEFVFSFLGRQSCSHIHIQRTPLGEKIIVQTAKPGLIVGKKGANIKSLTNTLRTKFHMENPQIEVEEIRNPYLDAASVARNLMSGFERFGPKRFKAMAYRAFEDTMKAGAVGIEIVISGRGVPGERAKSWRFSAGYLKKSGDISESFMDRAAEACNLRSGTVGVKVSILHPDVVLPDDIIYKEEKKEAAPKEEKTTA